MSGLVTQRTPNDCVIATIAMATGRPYDEVLRVGIECGAYVEGKGTRGDSKILEALGLSHEFENGRPVGDIVCKHRPHCLSAEFFRDLAWGRRAIFTVPSLNIEDGHHSVYWDGREVFDPNPPGKKRYVAFDDLLPSEVILFKETPA